MAKTSKQNKQNSRNGLGQKKGGMLDRKTNEDFNNEHPDRDDSGLIKGGMPRNDKHTRTSAEQMPVKMKSKLK